MILTPYNQTINDENFVLIWNIEAITLDEIIKILSNKCEKI